MWFMPLAGGVFVLSNNDNVFSWFVAFDGLSIIFQSALAFLFPRIGGPLLALSSLAALISLWPASHDADFARFAAERIYGPAFLCGVAIVWSSFSASRRAATLSKEQA
jgi:hypothetical protein